MYCYSHCWIIGRIFEYFNWKTSSFVQIMLSWQTNNSKDAFFNSFPTASHQVSFNVNYINLGEPKQALAFLSDCIYVCLSAVFTCTPPLINFLHLDAMKLHVLSDLHFTPDTCRVCLLRLVPLFTVSLIMFYSIFLVIIFLIIVE